MTSKTIVSALGLLVTATLLVADSAHARRSRGDHHGGAAYTGGFYYPYYLGRWGWGAAAAASVDAKAAARRAYDARDYDFLHRCYEPQRIRSGAYYTWRLVNVC
jgi:hypothetical protein